MTPAAQLITPKQLCVVVRKLLTRLTTSSTLEAEDVSTAATTTIPAPRSVEVWKRVVMEGIKFEGAVVKTPSKDASTTTANAEFSVLINFRSKNKELAKLLDDLGLLPPEVAAAVRAVNFAKNPSLRVIPPLGDLGLKTFLEAQVFQATGLPAQVILHEHRPTIRSRQSK